MIALADIERAAARLDPVIRHLPAQTSEPLSKLVGRTVIAKPEHLQRGGSFKIRGAFNFIASHLERGDISSVVAASAGNHAQGVALAARSEGLSATIFMPITASIPKVEATRGYGAEVILDGHSVDECIVLAQEFADENGATFVPPFDDPDILCGQATIGLELADESQGARVAVVPVGGGGLIAGVATALALRQSGIKVIGVEPKGAASMSAALSAGYPVALSSTNTMADGVAVRSACHLTFDHVCEYVDEVVTVEEEEISRAVLALLERTKWLVEPAGALSLAAIMADKVPSEGAAIAVLSGGNIDPLLLTRIIEHGLSAAGRYLMVRVVVSDTPGALASLTTVVADLGLNVISVDHHRSGVLVHIDEVEVILTLETRDVAHRDRIVPSLVARGFQAEKMT